MKTKAFLLAAFCVAPMRFSVDGEFVLGNIDPPGASDLATRLVALVSRQ